MLRIVQPGEKPMTPEEALETNRARLIAAIRRGIERHGIAGYTRLLNEQSARLRAEGDRLARSLKEQAGVTPPVAGPVNPA